MTNPPPDGTLQFNQVPPPPYVARRYVAGNYIIDQGRFGGWSVWIADDDSRRLLGGYQTLQAAQVAAGVHSAAGHDRASGLITALAAAVALADCSRELIGYREVLRDCVSGLYGARQARMVELIALLGDAVSIAQRLATVLEGDVRSGVLDDGRPDA